MGCHEPSSDNEQHLEGVVLEDTENDQNKVNPDHGPPEDSDAKKPNNLSVVSIIQYIYSIALLVISLVVVVSLMATEQTHLSQVTHPAVAFCLLAFLFLWLAMLEGGQASLVGIAPVSKELYEDSHPTTFKVARLVHKENNMERFIVGRQFLVVLVVFLVNLCGAALPESKIEWLPSILQSIFVGTGLAMVLVTVIIGQLTAQVNATKYMLDVINNRFVLYLVAYASLAVEYSGLLHSVYLVQIIISKITGKPRISNDSSRTVLQRVFFWIRVLFSCAVLVFGFAVAISALYSSKTTMWKGFPPTASVVLFLLLMAIAGMMEGMQIALLAVVKFPEEELSKFSIAKKSCDLAFQGSNLQAFLIGRQTLVTACMFIVARIIAPDVEPGEGENIYGVSDQVQEVLFNSNLLGTLITTVASSLIWRVVASSAPLQFLSNPLIYIILRLCLIINASGLCSAAWILARIQKWMLRFQSDDEYLGTAAPSEDESNSDDLEMQGTVFSRDSEAESHC
eukprot:scaffold1054_cov124-Cylindrotheca_fusiformis.AAC.10